LPYSLDKIITSVGGPRFMVWQIPYTKNWRFSLWDELDSPGPNGEPPPIPVKQWAEENNYSHMGAIWLIGAGRLYGIKRGGRWYVYPHTYRPTEIS
jgi:hypothetical protein